MVFYQPARAFHNGMQVVFVHKPSGTLIATDLIWNYPGSGTPKGTQAWKFGMDRVYLPFYKKFMIKDKGKCHIPPPMCTQQLTTPASSLYLELALLASVSSKADGHLAMQVCDLLCCAGAYQGATNRLVNQLQWDSILPCHGNYIPSGGKQILKNHLGLKM